MRRAEVYAARASPVVVRVVPEQVAGVGVRGRRESRTGAVSVAALEHPPTLADRGQKLVDVHPQVGEVDGRTGRTCHKVVVDWQGTAWVEDPSDDGEQHGQAMGTLSEVVVRPQQLA